MSKIIGYVRVSSIVSRDKGNSIKNQINKISEYCNYNDLECIDIIKDLGKSGMEFSKIDGYLELIDRCKNEKIDGVVVYCLSRIGRKMKDVIDIRNYLIRMILSFIVLKRILIIVIWWENY